MSHSKQAVHTAVSAVALSLGIVGSIAPVRADEAAPAAPDAQGAAVPQESRRDFQQVGGYKVVMNFTLKQSGSGWQ
jgi:hypothetical protein